MGGFFSPLRWLYGRLGAVASAPVGVAVPAFYLALAPVGFTAQVQGGGFTAQVQGGGFTALTGNG